MLPTMPFAMIMSSSATYQTVITRNSIQNLDITTLLMGNLLLLSYVLIGMTVVRYSTLRSENWQKNGGFPVVEFDRYIGFSKNQKHPVTGKQYSLILHWGFTRDSWRNIWMASATWRTFIYSTAHGCNLCRYAS